MSRATELAREEAARAEAEDDDADHGPTDPTPDPDDDDNDDDDERDDDPPSASSSTQADPEAEAPSIEKQQRDIEREMTRHHKALVKLMPDLDTLFSPCPSCQQFGYVLSPAPVLSTTHVLCEGCNGLGVVETPSRVDQHRYEQCDKCRGNGWLLNVTPPTITTDTNTATTFTPAAANGGDDPRVAELRALGYIVTPTTPPPPSAG